MKKIFVTIMCVMVAMSLVACSKEPSEGTPSTSVTTETVDVSETKMGDGIDDVTGDPSTITAVGVVETVLLDEADYKLTLEETTAEFTRKETGNNDGIFFPIQAENYTSQKVAFCFKDIKVNGEPILLTEAAALSERYGVEAEANGTAYPSVLIPFQSLYTSGITTIENVSFVVEIYPVTGSYGEFGDLLYTSEEIVFETIEGYGKESDNEEDEWDEEESTSSYTYNEVTVEEQVLLDDELLKICTTGDIIYEEGYAQRIGLTIENKTDDELMITSKYIAVNGYSQTTYLMNSIPAGEMLETSIDLFEYDLLLCNIDTISTVELVIDVGIVDPVTYPPITIKTSAADDEPSSAFEGTTVLNENGIEVIALDCQYDLKGSSGPVFIIINHSGSDIMTSFENVTINGIAVGIQGHSRLVNGLSHISLFDYSDDMSDNDIETITDFKCTLTICDTSFKKLVDNAKIEVSY